MTQKYLIMADGQWGGDVTEKEWWPHIGQYFPSYEVVWAELIVPLTQRPESLSLRLDLPKDWEDLAIKHYSIFAHFAAALDRSNRCYNMLSAFEDVYIHLGSTLDVTESFLLLIYKILNGNFASFPYLEDRNEFQKIVMKWFEEKREEYLKDITREGRIFAVRLFDEVPISVTETLNIKKEYDQYRKLANCIRHIRNKFIHDMVRAKVKTPVTGNNRKLVPKTDTKTFKKYQRWSDVVKAANSPSVLNGDFGEIKKIAVNDIHQSLISVNNLWAAFWQNVGSELKNRIPQRIKTIPTPPAISPNGITYSSLPATASAYPVSSISSE